MTNGFMIFLGIFTIIVITPFFLWAVLVLVTDIKELMEHRNLFNPEDLIGVMLGFLGVSLSILGYAIGFYILVN